eukprot:scaffold8319_cov277-Pinguiococcus_pyrenoidosus.AAC.6
MPPARSSGSPSSDLDALGRAGVIRNRCRATQRRSVAWARVLDPMLLPAFWKTMGSVFWCEVMKSKTRATWSSRMANV